MEWAFESLKGRSHVKVHHLDLKSCAPISFFTYNLDGDFHFGEQSWSFRWISKTWSRSADGFPM
jgi:hypothetical protein